MKMIAVTLLLLGAIRPAAPQHRLDPVSRSAGGTWLRNGPDPWCVLSAPMLLASVGRPRIGLAHFPSPWGLGELSASSAAFVFPLWSAGFGLAASRSGFGLYAETDFTIACGDSAGPVLYGVAVRYRNLTIERYGSAGMPGIDAGVIILTGEWFRWGIRITDLNRPFVGSSGERLRESVSLAVGVFPDGAPSVSFQAARDESGSFSTSASIVHDQDGLLSVRAGISGSFDRIHCGIALTPGGFGIGYGVAVHPDLGWSHSAWLTWEVPG